MGKQTKRQRAAQQRAAAAAVRRPDARPLQPDPRHVSRVPGTTNNRWQALVDLEKAAKTEARAIRARDVAVVRARGAGASWADIGRVLGVSRQAVAQRYGGGPR